MTKQFEALASGDTLELRIYAPIGAGLFGFGVTAQQISDEIRYSSGHSRIVVKFNSPGGTAYEGIAIRAILAEQDCETIAIVQGVAASAASVAAMGCKKIQMAVGSSFMLHESRLVISQAMDAKELASASAAAEALNENLAAIYSKRSGKSVAECRKLMAAETWLTAEKAVAQGFADEILGDKEDAEAMAFAASLDFTPFGYQHVPAKFQAEANGGDRDITDPDLPREPKTKTIPPAGDPRQLPLIPPPIQEPPKDDPQPSAALKAEASASRKRLDMTIKLIASAIGLQADADESAVVAAVSQLHAFVGELKSLTKSPSTEAVLGAIRGLQATAEQVPVLAAKVESQAKQLEDQERAAILAADKAAPEGRRLTPAMEAWAATQPLEVLKSFLAVAHPIVKVEAAASSGTSQPAVKTEAVASSETQTVAVLKHNGLAFEEMSGQAKADLFNEDRARYDELKRNHAERGAPRAQSQQQRASA